MSGIFKNLGAALIGLAIALMLLEGFLRIIDPFNFMIQGEEIVLNKNIKTKTTYGDVTVVKQINSLGFIGDDYPTNPEEYLKIFTIGGSTTACDALETEDTWPEQLAMRLRQDIKNLWLNNAGFAGHSTYGHNILYKDHVSEYKADYVFYLIGVNDVGLKTRSINDNVLAASRDTQNYSLWGKIYYFMTEKIRIVSNITNLLRSYKAYQLNINDLDFDIEKVVLEEDDEELEKILLEHHKKYYLSSYRQRVQKLINQTLKSGAQPILLTQPYLGGDDIIDEVTGVSLGKIAFPLGASWAGVSTDWDIPIDKSRMVNANLMWKVLELYNQVVRDVAEEMNVVMVDMGRLMPKDTRYYYDMMHYTAAGSHKFADILYSKMSGHLK